MLVGASGAGYGGQAAFFAGFLFFALFKGVIGALLGSPGEVGKRLAAQSAVKEKHDEQGKGEGSRVKDAPNALPARLQGIVKDRFGHRVGVLILRGGPLGVNRIAAMVFHRFQLI